MSNICKTVTLRTRKIKGGEQLSFYLDYYPGYRDESTMRVMRHESLGIYIYARPRTQRERDYNDRMREKAEALRCRRYESIVNERYDFFDRERMRGDFLAYFRTKADRKNCKWQHVYKHFYRFCQGKCTFGEINVDLCNKFREYLLTAPQTIHTEHRLHINSVAGYWSTFRAVLHTAYREHKIQENPNGFLERIDTIPMEKEHLSKDELVRLANTPCEYPVLKTAFLFACLTGLRKSDIKALTWENIQPYGDGGMYVTLRMQKTKELVSNPISDEALELIGGRHHEEDKLPLQPSYLRLIAGGCRHECLYGAAHAGSQERIDHADICKHGGREQAGVREQDYAETGTRPSGRQDGNRGVMPCSCRLYTFYILLSQPAYSTILYPFSYSYHKKD